MRGDLVTVALQGDLGKPRPALVIQSDFFAGHGSICVLPITGSCIEASLLRVDVQPSLGNGLNKASQVMIDKPVAVARERLGPVFGRLESERLVLVDRLLAVFLGIAS